jgi:Mg-chelatase subunit ChlD
MTMNALAKILALTTVIAAAPPDQAPPPASAPRPALSASRPEIEVAFVLDTTGSMGGLIEGAKRRIWSIARHLGEGQPRPEVRLGLVAYRDRGDEYVTRVHDFTRDMDALYGRLMSFQAEGGGDTPEHVSAALTDAVQKLSWTRGTGLKVIFLVGDAPPHVDYQDGYDYHLALREARAHGIAVETIQCGADPETARYWREIAGLGDGHYARIDANGGMPPQITPVDAELAQLNRELASTVIVGGSPEERARSSSRLAARTAMPAAAAAEAAGYFAKADRLAEKDLVNLPAAAQKLELKALNQSAAGAPPELAGKTDDEALAYLQAQKAQREKIQARIAEVARQRDAYLARRQTADGFDTQVLEALRARAAKYGIRY